MNYKWLIVLVIGILLFAYVIGSIGVNLNTGQRNATPTQTATVLVKNSNSNKITKPSTTPKPQGTYIVYYFTMSAPCPAGVQMNKDITSWSQNNPRVEFHMLPIDDPIGAQYNVRLSPTTVLVDKSTGQVVKIWVGVYDVNELNAYLK